MWRQRGVAGRVPPELPLMMTAAGEPSGRWRRPPWDQSVGPARARQALRPTGRDPRAVGVVRWQRVGMMGAEGGRTE